jgi:hypothetical protein
MKEEHEEPRTRNNDDSIRGKARATERTNQPEAEIGQNSAIRQQIQKKARMLCKRIEPIEAKRSFELFEIVHHPFI